MISKRVINFTGWIFIIFLTICKMFFSEEISLITTGFGGLICMIIGLSLIFYKPNFIKRE